ncbi:MAG: hypothetical protein LBP29_08035 [Treponema sp.]|jgi:hypothetical protein|nr:hypothetical protein [Treponema sp.]
MNRQDPRLRQEPLRFVKKETSGVSGCFYFSGNRTPFGVRLSLSNRLLMLLSRPNSPLYFADFLHIQTKNPDYRAVLAGTLIS